MGFCVIVWYAPSAQANATQRHTRARSEEKNAICLDDPRIVVCFWLGDFRP